MTEGITFIPPLYASTIEAGLRAQCPCCIRSMDAYENDRLTTEDEEQFEQMLIDNAYIDPGEDSILDRGEYGFSLLEQTGIDEAMLNSYY
ncbi:hypothetical protein ACFL56_03530, partial [Candidatus Margulisiibacteriota bacterium]